ncbi:MAG TPA: hypothetical protein PKG54_17500 [Phycisphaerae bacterium]|jgi:hypothetical protein|nr:hypothetical protein [Phycisphaerae bacterium]HOB76309.1 hypothetical protein [Phycisphaerae bacterium]HOJ53795.1 hypothetical protein [Phycisphaerae bacterium]HOL28269.1 hypothetical protein [Phycisphaerae bacterium]HPP21477.1 hypothetical protein [Phycisphaerae bacterium]
MHALREIQAGKMPALPQSSRSALLGGGHPARLTGRSAKRLDPEGQYDLVFGVNPNIQGPGRR